MDNTEKTQKLKQINDELSTLPDAFLVYKTIRGHKQPYLQWHEDGKTKSRYVKVEERERILIEIARREELLQEKKCLLAYTNTLQDAWKKYPGLRMQNNLTMPVGLGIQSFAEMIEKKVFYIDKSMFIKEWWEDESKVNLITRPRRFGKSLNLDMLDCFFSDRYENRHDLFANLQIWECRNYRRLQGKWPVLYFDFSNMKTGDYKTLRAQLRNYILNEYYRQGFIKLDEWKPDETWSMDDFEFYLQRLCTLMADRNIQKKIIILIDEYDTPIQESWGKPSYQDTVCLMRIVFHCLLKGNPYLKKALLTGITRVSQESLFSDLNNLRVSTVMNDEYASYFGFTEEEVFASLDSQDMNEHAYVKQWYDGFTIGSHHDIYNPWSITYYLLNRRLDTYWANTSSNTLAGQIINRASPALKECFVKLMNGESIEVGLKENIIWEDLEWDENLIWGLLLAAGYITGSCIDFRKKIYQIHITNLETMSIFEELFSRWFSGSVHKDYNEFIKAMFRGDATVMTDSLNEIMLEAFSYYDVSGKSENRKTENFYHGLVLGMVSSLRHDYVITSNRESGYGRYDIVIEPREKTYDQSGIDQQESDQQESIPQTVIKNIGAKKSIILEFKVSTNIDMKSDLSEALTKEAENALMQIKGQKYDTDLISRGIPESEILCYGIAFHGKKAKVNI